MILSINLLESEKSREYRNWGLRKDCHEVNRRRLFSYNIEEERSFISPKCQCCRYNYTKYKEYIKYQDDQKYISTPPIMIKPHKTKKTGAYKFSIFSFNPPVNIHSDAMVFIITTWDALLKEPCALKKYATNSTCYK